MTQSTYDEDSENKVERLQQENAHLRDLLKWCWEESVYYQFRCSWGEVEIDHTMGTKEDCPDCKAYNRIKAIVEGK